MNIEEERKLITSVFSTPDGEKLLEHFLQQCVLAPIFTTNSHELACRAGVQDFITSLITQIGVFSDE